LNVRTYSLCFLGFGRVNRSLVRLLAARESDLRINGVAYRLTGVASTRLGWIADPAGLPASLVEAGDVHTLRSHVGGRVMGSRGIDDWLDRARADVVFEATSLNLETGKPAVDYIRKALEFGADAITANKGPVLHAYEELSDLAAKQGRRFLFESTVMDGIPLFSLFQETLPTIEVKSFHGVLNSTTNLILSRMENGLTFDEALQLAQNLGIAEENADFDIDGYDAAIKTALLVRIIMGAQLRLPDIDRQGIRNLDLDAVRAARKIGKPYRLICRASRDGGRVRASVRPEQVPLTDPAAWVTDTSSVVCFETDIFPKITITETNPGLDATAYGMFSDFVRAVCRTPCSKTPKRESPLTEVPIERANRSSL